MLSLYEQNLKALTSQNPELAAQLLAIEGNENYEVFVDENDPLNINCLHVKTNQVLYQTRAIDEVTELFKTLEDKLERYPMLYFFGIGNGVLFKLLLQNSIHKRIVVVEPDMELLYIALNLNDFSKEIGSGQLRLFHESQIELPVAIELFSDQDAKVFVKLYNLEITSPFYEYNFSSQMLTCNAIFLQAIEHVIFGLGNDTTDALVGLKHQIINVFKMLKTPTFLEFIKKAKNSDVAVIVSTGPSLKKQLAQLKKIKDNVTIFCIDASFPILEREDIKPDVVISIERVAETAKFYELTSKEFQDGVVFSITSIVHPELLKQIKSGTLQINMRPFGYTRYFDLPEYGYVGIGMSAANMAFELVYHSKFKKCILIGQDLAYGEDGSTHSDGHLYGSDIEKSDLKTFDVVAYGGKGFVKTTKMWHEFKNFFENDIYHTSKEGMLTINATEGGVRIEGSVEIPFKDACEEHVDTSSKKDKIELLPPEKEYMEKNIQKTEVLIDEMQSYSEKLYSEIETLFKDVMQMCEAMDKIDAYSNLSKVDYDALAELMARIDTFKGYFDQEKFINIFIDATQAIIVHQELELAKIQVRPIRSDDDKRRKMIEWIYAHRNWLFSLAGSISAVVDTIHMAREESMDISKLTHIDVYADDERVDFIVIENIIDQNLYDIKRLCLDYELSDKMKDKKVRFVYCGEEIEMDAYLVLSNENGYERFSFENSLYETIDSSKFVQRNIHDTVGFFVVPDNYQSFEFIETVRKILIDFPNIRIKAVCWNEYDEKIIDELFIDSFDQIVKIKPKDIYEFANSIDLYLSDKDYKSISSKKIKEIIRRDIKDKKIVVLNYMKDDEKRYEDEVIFEELNFREGSVENIEVHDNGKVVDVLVPKFSNNLADIKQVCFDYMFEKEKSFEFKYVTKDGKSIGLNMLKYEDENINKYSFMNSLEVTVCRDYKDVSEKKSIGFLATKENLEAKSFIETIEKIVNKFQKVNLNIFYLNLEELNKSKKLFEKYSNVNFIQIESFISLIKKSSIFIFDNFANDTTNRKIISLLWEYIPQVLVVNAHSKGNADCRNLTIREFDKRFINTKLLKYINKFPIDQKFIMEYKDSYHQLFYNPILTKCQLPLIDLDENAFKFRVIKVIDYALKSDVLIEEVFKLKRLEVIL